MAQPSELLAQLATAAQNQDAKAVAQCRDDILNLELSNEAAIMARYRLGLYTLHQEKQLDAAIEIFKDIASSHIQCDDRFEAQITYAICLWAKNKRPQAIFELRRVLSAVKTSSIHAAMALDYLAIFLRDSNAPKDDIAKADKERVETLQTLAKREKNVDDQSQIKLRLAAALEERDAVGDLDQAKAIVKSVVDIASKLSKPNASAAREALKRVSKIRRK